MTNDPSGEIARDVRTSLAGGPLTPRQAKLYSQRLRLDMGQEGLMSFAAGDVSAYLDESLLLLTCGLLECRSHPKSDWRASIKRAAEILEWLSQAKLKPVNAPLHLLSAAAYQVANCPAMATASLRRVPEDQPFSVLLREFLRGDFPAALKATYSYWQQAGTSATEPADASPSITTLVHRHIIMCIGTVCSYFRTGNDQIISRSLVKLDNLAFCLIHSSDPYSSTLALLTAAASRQFVESSIWPQVNLLGVTSSEAASAALAQFARSAFINRRSLVWPSQATGISRLCVDSSFVLCTPTGSGKTTVATLAIVQGLFAEPPVNLPRPAEPSPGNLILYIVPSRALAAEVESKLAQDLRGIATESVVVTGLYGGVDWGPTDAWLQTSKATVVICTFEKADALLRYLGVLFLERVRLVVIDEAHLVEQNRARLADLADGSSRAFRLEQLGTRLFRARDRYGFRIMALSAVAANAAPALARWVAGTPGAVPTTSAYRSTRQMLGRLEISATGDYRIQYDLMDGRSLKFDEAGPPGSPYVDHPFPAPPGGIPADQGPEERLRAPTLWAALHLAAKRPDGSTPSVLISLTQNMEAFAKSCADILDVWSKGSLPDYRAVGQSNETWSRCLASAADYFTEQSVEYRLLRQGIAVHHGKMPGLLARRLKVAIDNGLVRVIIATSTLSEGVNIPVNFLLIPSLYRGQDALGLQEFSNLIGRAGRAGVSGEGSVLVVLPEVESRGNGRGRRQEVVSRQRQAYNQLVAKLEEATAASKDAPLADEASSPLAHLLRALRSAWARVAVIDDPEKFGVWLEQTVVIGTEENAGPMYTYLDSLDGFLLAAIQEVEELSNSDVGPAQLEEELALIWRRTYACAAAQEEASLAKIWLTRGKVIKERYPDATQRRHIYKTSLSPRSATCLLNLVGAVRTALLDGTDYAVWEPEQRFEFVRRILGLLSGVPSFRIGSMLGRRKNFSDWPKLLRWWLAKSTLSEQPKPKEITIWFDFVAKNFVYRGAWGIGSTIGLLLQAADDEPPVRALEIGDWPRSGLPWIAFWMKELITWGTLEPVAAFLLARGNAVDRSQAERDARAYYLTVPTGMDANDILDPRLVRDWVEDRCFRPLPKHPPQRFNFAAVLVRPTEAYSERRLDVTPLDAAGRLNWVDSAGYSVAYSDRPDTWPPDPSSFEFELDVIKARILGSPYLRHA